MADRVHAFSRISGASVKRMRTKTEAAAQPKPAPMTSRGGPLLPTILLVEDEDFVRDVTCQVLLFAGYQVLSARNAAEAKQIFAERGDKVSLLVTDVALPGRNGSELAREFHAAQPRLRTLLISGYPQASRPQRHSSEGSVLYLAKPFSAETLMRKVREALESGQGSKPEAGLARSASAE